MISIKYHNIILSFKNKASSNCFFNLLAHIERVSKHIEVTKETIIKLEKQLEYCKQNLPIKEQKRQRLLSVLIKEIERRRIGG